MLQCVFTPAIPRDGDLDLDLTGAGIVGAAQIAAFLKAVGLRERVDLA
jgi:hypothetical protein